MRILASAAAMISGCKIKMKTDEALTEALIRTLSKIFNKSHVTFNDHPGKIKVGQNLIFSSVNMIITEKTIFVIDAVFQITQLKAVNSLLISIECL